MFSDKTFPVSTRYYEVELSPSVSSEDVHKNRRWLNTATVATILTYISNPAEHVETMRVI